MHKIESEQVIAFLISSYIIHDKLNSEGMFIFLFKPEERKTGHWILK